MNAATDKRMNTIGMMVAIALVVERRESEVGEWAVSVAGTGKTLEPGRVVASVVVMMDVMAVGSP